MTSVSIRKRCEDAGCSNVGDMMASSPENDRKHRSHEFHFSDDDDDINLVKRKRNAEAARRSREKKKELQKQKVLELESKLDRVTKDYELYKKNYKEICEERTKWKQKETYITNVLVGLRAAFRKQKEHISRLEAQNMALRISNFSSFPPPFLNAVNSVHPVHPPSSTNPQQPSAPLPPQDLQGSWRYPPMVNSDAPGATNFDMQVEERDIADMNLDNLDQLFQDNF
jgi:hypothetical protein